MPIITKSEAEKKDFVIVKDKKTSAIARIVAPHPLQIGVEGFKDCTLTVKGDECIEGSLTINHGVKGVFKLPDGTPSVKEGPGIKVIPHSDGGITISTLQAVNNLITVGRGLTSVSASDGGLTLSLSPNIRQVTAGSGLVSRIVSDTLQISLDRTDVATFAGGTFTGPLVAAGGLSGSLQFLQDGMTPFIVGGTGISVVTGSNGQVTISSTYQDMNDEITGSLSSYITAGPGIQILTGSSGQIQISVTGSLTSSGSPPAAAGVGTELVMNGALTGIFDGLNRVFQLDAVPADSSTLMLWMNGQLLVQGSDYVVSGSAVTLIDGLSPVEGDVLRAMYTRQVSAKLYALNERPTNLISSGSIMTGMRLARRPDPSSSLMLFLNGQLMTQGDDSDYSLQEETVTFNRPFLTDDVVLTTYSYAV